MIGPARAAAADWTPLTARLAADGFNRQAMEALFSRPEVLFEPEAMAGKLKGLIRSRTGEAASLTAALRKSFYRNYLTRIAIARAHSYLIDNKAVLEEVIRKIRRPRRNNRLDPPHRNPSRQEYRQPVRLQPPGQHGPLHRSGNPSSLPGCLADHPRHRGVRPQPLAGEGRLGLRRTQSIAPAGREGRRRSARNPGIHIRGDRPVPVHAFQRYCLRRGRRS